MKHPLLKAEKRTVLGKKVKKLRREGLLPANVYGKNLASVALQVKVADFEKVHKEVGETGLVDLDFDGKAKPVLIKNLQMNYKSRTPLHADFYQVNLKEKIRSMIPLLLTGEAQAVTDKAGMLMQNLSEVEVEALPENLPENLELSIEHLAAVGDSINVTDLKAPEGVVILTEESQVIAKIAELVTAEAEADAEAESEAAESASTEGETNETAATSAESSGEPKDESND